MAQNPQIISFRLSPKFQIPRIGTTRVVLSEQLTAFQISVSVAVINRKEFDTGLIATLAFTPVLINDCLTNTNPVSFIPRPYDSGMTLIVLHHVPKASLAPSLPRFRGSLLTLNANALLNSSLPS